MRRNVTINLLVSVAAIEAVCLGQVAEAAAVVFFFALAEAFEAFGETRLQKAVFELIDRSSKTAHRADGRVLPVDQV